MTKSLVFRPDAHDDVNLISQNIEVAKKTKAKAVISLGDNFNPQAMLSMAGQNAENDKEAMEKFIEIFNQTLQGHANLAKNYGVQVYSVLGNHDIDIDNKNIKKLYGNIEDIAGLKVGGGCSSSENIEIMEKLFGDKYGHMTADAQKKVAESLAKGPTLDVLVLHKGIHEKTAGNNKTFPVDASMKAYADKKHPGVVINGHIHERTLVGMDEKGTIHISVGRDVHSSAELIYDDSNKLLKINLYRLKKAA